MLSDASDDVRQLSCLFLDVWVDCFRPVVDDSISSDILASIAARILSQEEESEEVRILLYGILKRMVESCRVTLLWHIRDLFECFIVGVGDLCPGVQQGACDLICKYCNKAISTAAHAPESLPRLAESLIQNCRHRQWRVRLACVEALGSLFSVFAVSDHCDELFAGLLILSSDRSDAVKEALVDCLKHWLLAASGISSTIPEWTSRIFSVLAAMLFDTSSVSMKTIAGIDSIQGSPFWKPLLSASVRVIVMNEKYPTFLTNESVFRFSKLHAPFLTDYAVAALGDPHADHSHAVKCLLLAAVHVSPDQLGLVLPIIAKHLQYDANSLLIPSVWAHALSTRVVVVAMTACSDVGGIVQVLHRLILDATDPCLSYSKELLVLVETVHVSSGNSEAVSGCIEAFLVKLKGSGDVMSDGCRRRLVAVLLQCHSASSCMQRCMQLLGPAVWNDYFTEYVVSQATDLETVKLFLRNASVDSCILPALSDVLSRVTQVMHANTVEGKLDCLEICYVLGDRKALTHAVADEFILTVISPCLEWTSGLAQSKMRKLALVTLRHFLSRYKCSVGDTCMRHVVACMEDAWSPDNRLLALLVVGGLGLVLTPLHQHVVARLDDTHNEIRIQAARLLGCMALDPACPQSVTHSLLIHLDDADESVGLAVREALANASSPDLLHAVKSKLQCGNVIHRSRFLSLIQ